MNLKFTMRKRDLYELISKEKQRLHITQRDYPINIFELCKRFSNVVIKEVNFITKDLRGLVRIASNKNENHVILVNSNKTFEEKNYHGTHEFAHILTITDSPGTTLQCFEKIRPNQDTYIEWLANEGAAEFLMPYREVLPFVKKESESFDESSLPILDLTERLSSMYNVSFTVAQNRIRNLSYEIWQYLHGFNIDEIEILSKSEQVKKNIHIEALPEIENNMLFKLWASEPQQPFFYYSTSYRFAI